MRTPHYLTLTATAVLLLAACGDGDAGEQAVDEPAAESTNGTTDEEPDDAIDEEVDEDGGTGELDPEADPDPAADDGLVTTTAEDDDVEAVLDRARDAIEERGLNLMTEVDHAANAATVDLDLAPTVVLVFGNPEAGTPLMLEQRSTAIDLPQKLLVAETDDGAIEITYNDPAYLAERHGLDPELEPLAGAADALDGIASDAAG